MQQQLHSPPSKDVTETSFPNTLWHFERGGVFAVKLQVHENRTTATGEIHSSLSVVKRGHTFPREAFRGPRPRTARETGVARNVLGFGGPLAGAG